MKKLLICFWFYFFAVVHSQTTIFSESPVDFVNPLMGTDSKYELSNGNTYAAIGLPWGMNYWTPQTNEMGNGWAYQYAADKMNGFKQTHQPSPWMNDYGYFSLMPITRKMVFKEKERQSWFSHKAEVSMPFYYKVYLADHHVTTEIAPTERAAFFRFTFPEKDSAFVVIDAIDKGSYVKIIPAENKIIGYSTRNRGSVSENFRNYFVIQFNMPFRVSKGWDQDHWVNKDEIKSSHAGAAIGFGNFSSSTMIEAKVASSFISFEQAELNLKREIGNKNFDQIKTEGKTRWNEVLGKIKVSGGTEDQLRTFYSCLYRTVMFPMKMYELDAQNKAIHYSPYNGKTMEGKRFAGTGFWDTFRALYPLLNLVYPSISREMQEGLINDYKEGGWLPEWSSPGYRGIMIGNNSASVVSEAYVKGLRGYDIETLWQALVHGAHHEGPAATGRKGVEFYNQLGYIPNDVKIDENVARTLEYAYDDYAIYTLGKALGKADSEINEYKERALNYKNLYYPRFSLMAPKSKDGKFTADFNPFSWGGPFTEGNSYHYSWSVFQDINGLKNLMGGDRKFISMLDSIFMLPPNFGDYSYYGEVIHEMREMQIANFGQYAHGNQPIQHMIYLYNYTSQPYKSQYWVREVMNRLYTPNPDGYCGDEDNGQTSAWYVFSALGFYPVTPAHPEYVTAAPLFKHAEISFENGKKLTINAPENSAEKRYVKHSSFNGKELKTNMLDHFELMKGGEIEIKMSEKPNLKRNTKKEAYPFSMSGSN
ncbi:MAG: GH92 family glycosyl hydrolase [Chryseobacterium sp.]|nr:GH92 family glycosyl hydrolase [Chryseobacterium sp.]